MTELRQYYFNLFRERCSVIWKDKGKAVVTDPGFFDAEEETHFLEALSREGVTPCAIMLTHGHMDHIFGVRALQDRFNIPVYMHPDEKQLLLCNAASAARFNIKAPDISFRTTGIADGDRLELGGMTFEVIGTPGHTPGGVCYLNREESLIFTGDTLFNGAIGRTDLELGDYDKEIVAIMEKLMLLDSDIRIIPGHGACSTIGYERTHNPFLQPFNEAEEEFDPDLEGVEIHA